MLESRIKWNVRKDSSSNFEVAFKYRDRKHICCLEEKKWNPKTRHCSLLFTHYGSYLHLDFSIPHLHTMPFSIRPNWRINTSISMCRQPFQHYAIRQVKPWRNRKYTCHVRVISVRTSH